MTNAEAIRLLKYNSNVIHKTINGETDSNEVEALDMAIKALERESVFEDMKAEIKECSFPYTIRESGWDESEDVYMAKEETEVVRLDTIFEIIDKHIGKENINEKDTSNY